MIQTAYKTRSFRPARRGYGLDINLIDIGTRNSYDPTPLGLIDRLRRELKIWRSETAFTSSLDQKLSHPSYLNIVGMGESVVDLLIEELKARPGLEVYALEDIVGHCPYGEESFGDISSMSDAWIQTYGK